ncbi:MAG: glycosyltransferase family 1 protein [Phototrophicales bacterium]|nr:MAG: glycosyltransferase family 1 protein [Phototrophicales bacterium]RMG74000.1 MAG: glycosyltransferase family 1 protein [Chloroflexota bacterium]
MNQDKLKILICLLYYLPHRTGMQLYIERVAEALVQRGHEVTVLVARHRPDLKPEEVINGVRIVRLWAPPIPISRGMLMPMYPFAAYRLMKQHDVVSVHTPMLETGLLAFLAKLTGKQIIVTHHGDLLLPKSLPNRLIQGTMFMLYKLLARQAPRIVAYTEDYADHSYYLKPFRDKVKVIYPPITMPEPQPERVAELRTAWSHDGGPVIGYAGRFVQEKRPDLLIRSLDVINQKFPDARIVFAGQYDIPYENTWELYQPVVQRYKDQLIFLGMIENMQEMANFFAACDVLALTSDSECFALVQVEAMLCGTPVVMTNTPGGRVPVQVTGMGELTQPGDYKSIGNAILRVLENPQHYHHSREEIAATFSFEETVNRYEALFKEYAKRG